jgi:hypothetical protein
MLGLSLTDRAIEVLKSKFFLLDVCFEKSVESLTTDTLRQKSRETKNNELNLSNILTQIRQSMCQNFVNLAKQQANVA